MPPGARAGRCIEGEITARVENPADDHVPAIVIGDREKLETDGPTLALLHAFQRALDRANRLVVVGYSFGDAHVNAVVRDWLNSDDSRTITVLEPSWPATAAVDGDYRAVLTQQLGVELPDSLPRRLHVVRETTRVGLQRAG